ncbi:MAG: hypothetical protein KDC57_14550 [Saprospiraceae bacterium]|nr:hypothetical protein [Saprospiraceae bacterium]
MRRWVQQMRETIFKKILQNVRRRREDTATTDPNLKVTSIGILFDGTLPEDRQVLDRLVQQLRQSSNQVLVLGYIDNYSIATTYPFKHFYKKHVNWFYVPKHPDIDKFSRIHYDILMNLGRPDQFTLHYIAKSALASFKVGPHYPGIEIYDVMVRAPQEHDLDEFIDNVKRLLKNIQYRND